MKRLSYLFIPMLLASNLAAQTIIFKDGRTVVGTGLRRAGDSIMNTVKLGANTGEIGYPVAAIAKIEFPEPSQIKAASTTLANGQPTQALVEIEPVILFYAPFRGIPGGWWSQAALVKISALMESKKDTEAEILINELSNFSDDPQIALAAKVPLAASILAKGDVAKALETSESVIRAATRPETLAGAWLVKAQALLAKRDYEPALLAFLHITVFQPEQILPQSAALLGAAHSYKALDDVANARASLEELLRVYPSSASAAEAKVFLATLAKPMNKS